MSCYVPSFVWARAACGRSCSLRRPGEAISDYSQLQTGRSKAALLGAIWSGLNALVPAVVGAAVFTITSRALDPAAFGLVALAVTVTSFTSILAPSGFGEALVQRATVKEAHLDTVFWLCTAAGVLAVVLSFVVSIPVAEHLGQPLLLQLIPLVSTKVLFDMLAVTPMAVLTRRMSFHLVAVRTMIASVVAGAVCLTLLWAGWGLWALAASQVAASAASSVGAFAGAKWKPKLRFSMSSLQELRRYGVFASGTKVLGAVYPDQLLLGLLLGPFALGIFSFSRRIYQIFNDLIAGALGTVAHSFLSSLQAESEKVKDGFLLITFLSSAVAFALFGGIAVTATELIPTLFGKEWLSSVWSVRAFCLIGLMSSVGFVQAALINSQGHAKWWFFYQLSKQTVLVLAVIVSYRWGVSAVVWSMAVISFAIWPFTVLKSAEVIDIRLWMYVRRFIAPLSACTTMIVAVTAMIHATSIDNDWLRLFSLIAVGGGCYVTVLFAMSYKTMLRLFDFIRNRRS